ncbi:MAG: endo alpha-1,4 polygalactosaminidase [Chloroflexi bacterium]|nr:endo alpha-1,4 polygalactosaminidase [Chloroflexota bacterium]
MSATMEAAQAASGSWWRPRPGQSWQWQLSGLPVDTSIAADIYDLDLFETSRETVAQLDSQGRRVICYLSAGTFEHWRPDVGLFPQGVIGRPYVGCPGEWWLDIRQMDVLAPIIEARLDLCQGKGFDGVEPDNIDAYQAATGFPLSSQDQLNFNRWLARAAHARGLSIGLKNDPDQAMDLADDFDWALGEDCSAQGWCEAFASFVARGKLVVAVEYTDSGVDWQAACTQTRRLGFSMVLKNRDLDAWLATCP